MAYLMRGCLSYFYQSIIEFPSVYVIVHPTIHGA